MSTPKAKRQPLSDNRKLLIIIIAICLATIIAVSVTLGVLLKEPDKSFEDQDTNTTPSSNLPIKNGNFALVNSEDTAYPKSAVNWTKYGYKDAENFETIDTTANAVMGIVDTAEDNWATVITDLKAEDIDLTMDSNPHQHKLNENEKHDNSNVYMIAAKKATSAAIMSDSVSVSATTSVKISMWLYTKQLTSGKATIMIQNSSTTPNAKEENRYAYKYDIDQSAGDDSGWSYHEFYVFNRKTSTQYIRVSVGLGNNYVSTDNTAEGVLFIDDIAYETVTANDYRIKADEPESNDTTFKIIEKEEETTVAQQSAYLTLSDIDGQAKEIDFKTSDEYVNLAKVSPFTTKDDFTKPEDSTTTGDFGIYMLTNDGKVHAPVALQLSSPLKVELDEDNDKIQDYQHVSFWVRTRTLNNNALAFANIVVEKSDDYVEANAADATWTELSGGDFTAKTEQNIEKDTNNGWTKYDIYLKPAENTTYIRIKFALGSAKGYDGIDYAPQGEMFVTTPYFETISSSAYTNASSGTATKKFDLTGSTADTTVSNGSFSSVVANAKQPSNWTPVFAGQNIIYKDGLNDEKITDLRTDLAAVEGSGVIRWKDTGINDGYENTDDDEGRVLKLVNNAKTSYGYMSSDLSLSAHNVYVFSVLAKVERSTNALPYFYLLENGAARDKAILAKVDNVYSTRVSGDRFCLSDEPYKNTDWVRYYIVYVTGDESMTVRLALFNGSIDGKTLADAGSTVYYDKVSMNTLGTYSLVEDEDNKDATEYKVSFSPSTGFAAFKDCTTIDEVKAEIENIAKTESAVAFAQPDDSEWTAMLKIPDPTNDDDDDDKTDDTTTPRDVNLGLLFSILSSVILVGALAVVIVIKVFKNKKRTA